MAIINKLRISRTSFAIVIVLTPILLLTVRLAWAIYQTSLHHNDEDPQQHSASPSFSFHSESPTASALFPFSPSSSSGRDRPRDSASQPPSQFTTVPSISLTSSAPLSSSSLPSVSSSLPPSAPPPSLSPSIPSFGISTTHHFFDNLTESSKYDSTCLPNPCQNNGICASNPNNRYYKCICASGYKGYNCNEQDLEDPNFRSSWMRGTHGIGYRIYGGTNMDTNMFDAWELAKQINGTSISYVIVGLSSGASGDRYISPHPVLTNLSRGVTPKDVGDGFPLCSSTSGCVPPDPNSGRNQPTYNPKFTNFPLERYEDKDLFEQLLDAMDSINVNVIAYMAAQGPPMLKAGESNVFDYPLYRNGFVSGGYLVDSVQECQTRWNVTSGNCSPSARRWVEWVVKEYCTQTPKADCKGKFTTTAAGYNFDDVYMNGSDLNNAIKEAYAEVIVDYYAKKHTRIRGFWFDQANDDIINRAKITAAVRRHIPNAAIALNNGYKIPLRNNNPDSPLGEDYTYGHMKPIKGGSNPVDGSYNFGLILSVEKSINGFVYPNPKFNVFGDENDLSEDDIPSNPYLQNTFDIKYTKQAGKASLAHVFFPTSDHWNNGDLVWNLRQATEWMKRVLDANGAWTWNVKRTKWNVDDISNNPATIASEDMDFIQQVFAGLKGGTNPIMGPYQFNGHNCDSIDPNVPCECLSHSGTTTGWGCAEDVTEPDKPVPVCVDDLNANEELWFVDVGFGKKEILP
uniref:EGF-like domain-containing protein n=1 Tax=Ditylum brightwellii TaxID=49249 RepID=A0A6V2F990_9STRA